ncbi:cardiolipin synthase [Maribacter polysaccharolyticus]|uniref:cardiolipin synthase n=1 Tax=Maribacter polysaccharolyticus TaxID=3020831 RepID=UPI00237FBF11|nr:cardiolipin synthase [Maribacter polysaccharolyticus]MDE3740828.1 cardiolipin synthase [Maribacter polysaccharolyticus]
MYWKIALIIYVFIAIGMVLSLLVNGIKPAKTLAWLLAIFTIPVAGILLYWMIGRNRKKYSWKEIHEDIAIHDYLEKVQQKQDTVEPTEMDFKEFSKITRMVEKNNGFKPTKNNEVKLLKDGKATFDAIFDALESAEEYIYLLYYIFEEGELANRLISLFEEKVKKGVKIKIIYDGVGSYTLSKKYIAKLKSIGVEVNPFLPFKLGRFLSSVNYRNHRKIIIVDGKIAFTGGINISDKYLKGDLVLGKWHDMHIQLKGASVLELKVVFEIDWFLVSGDNSEFKRELPSLKEKIGNQIVQIVYGGPDHYFSPIGQTYFALINNAQKYIYITNPYIIPGTTILHSLEVAALSGVDVRLMLSDKADSALVNWSVRSYFESLLKAGVKIYLFPKGFLHSKIIVIDDHLVSIGTANMDIRSFEQNYEVNALVFNQETALILKQDFLNEIDQSIPLDYETFKNRSYLEKLKEGFAKIFSPIL